MFILYNAQVLKLDGEREGSYLTEYRRGQGGRSFRLRKIWYNIALERSGNFVTKFPDIYFKMHKICIELYSV